MRRFERKPKLLIFGIYMAIAFLSTFLGMGMEFTPLIPLLMIISKENAYDRIYRLALLAVPFSLGWTAGLTNPFNVQIAQKIAEVPMGSGMGFIYMMKYGKRAKLMLLLFITLCLIAFAILAVAVLVSY